MTDEESRRRERAQSALFPVVGIDEIQVLGGLEAHVVSLLGVQTAACSVWVRPSTLDHIREQRGINRADAEFALQHMAAAVIRPTFCGHDPSIKRRDPHRKGLVHWVASVERYLFVAIKFVEAARADSATDEWWISTAYPLNDNFLRKGRWRDSLHLVKWGVDD